MTGLSVSSRSSEQQALHMIPFSIIERINVPKINCSIEMIKNTPRPGSLNEYMGSVWT